MPKLSWMSLVRGAKQVVIQEVLLTILNKIVILLMVHTHHQHGVIGRGAEMMTLLVPPY